MPSWASPVVLAVASSALEDTAGRQNSSWAFVLAWALLHVHGRVAVVSCLAWGSMTPVGIAVGAAAAEGDGGGGEYARMLREGWSCAFRRQIHP